MTLNSNVKAIAQLDEAIARLTATRDDMQKRHDETLAAIAEAEKQTAGHAIEQMREQFRQMSAAFGSALGRLFR